MSSLNWFRFHPLTCAVIAVAVVVLVLLNSSCDLYFGSGSTTTLKFGHGWPLHFQNGPAPGPGSSSPNANGLVPNYIWGHPEYNDDPEIMAGYAAELEGMPQTPWGLQSLAKLSIIGAVVDLLVAVAVLFLLSLACEVSIYSAGRQVDNVYSVASLFLVLAVSATAVCVLVADARSYALVALAGIVGSILATGIMLHRGYQ